MSDVKIRVTKEFSFDASHQLVGHIGKCANVHGHTYRVAVTVEGALKSNGSDEGFVMDFADLKFVVKPIIDEMDHSFLSSGDEPILKEISNHDLKMYHLGQRTTAEHLSLHLFYRIGSYLIDLDNTLKLVSVKVWETPTSCAEVYV